MLPATSPSAIATNRRLCYAFRRAAGRDVGATHGTTVLKLPNAAGLVPTCIVATTAFDTMPKLRLTTAVSITGSGVVTSVGHVHLPPVRCHRYAFGVNPTAPWRPRSPPMGRSPTRYCHPGSPRTRTARCWSPPRRRRRRAFPPALWQVPSLTRVYHRHGASCSRG